MREKWQKANSAVSPAKGNELIFSAFFAWKWFAAGLK